MSNFKNIKDFFLNNFLVSSSMKKFHLDLSEESEKTVYDPFVINLGKNVTLEFKEFHGSYYIGFSKISPGSSECRNRFNLPVSLLSNLKTATQAMIKHVSKK